MRAGCAARCASATSTWTSAPAAAGPARSTCAPKRRSCAAAPSWCGSCPTRCSSSGGLRRQQLRLRQGRAQHPLDQFAHRADRAAERQPLGAAEEETPVDVAGESEGEALVDAELSHLRLSVAQPANLEAVPGERALLFLRGVRLKLRQALEVALEPGRAHGARRKSRDAHEDDDVLRLGLGEDALEFGMRVPFLG